MTKLNRPINSILPDTSPAPTPQVDPEPAGADTVQGGSDELASNQVSQPWKDARTHADLDAAVPEGTELPEGWGGMTIPNKQAWLDENVEVTPQ